MLGKIKMAIYATVGLLLGVLALRIRSLRKAANSSQVKYFLEREKNLTEKIRAADRNSRESLARARELNRKRLEVMRERSKK